MLVEINIYFLHLCAYVPPCIPPWKILDMLEATDVQNGTRKTAFVSRSELSIVPVVPWEGPPADQLPNFYRAILTFERSVYA